MPDYISCEVTVALSLADIIAASEGGLKLCETTDPDVARKKIHVFGYDIQPATRDGYIEEQLQGEFVSIVIQPSDDESHQLLEPDAAVSDPFELGTLDVLFKRMVRAFEMADNDWRSKQYLHFVDCISAIARDLHYAGWQGNTNITGVRRNGRPGYPMVENEEEQGVDLMGAYFVDWGDVQLAG